MRVIRMKKLMSFVLALAALFTCSASADVKRDQLLVFHMDFNIIQMRRDLVMELLNSASKSGYNAILWEIENKVTLPSLESFYFSISSPRDLKKGSISGLSSPVNDLKSFIGSSDAPFSRKVFLNFMESSLSQTSPFFSKTEYR